MLIFLDLYIFLLHHGYVFLYFPVLFVNVIVNNIDAKRMNSACVSVCVCTAPKSQVHGKFHFSRISSDSIIQKVILT